MKAHIQYPMYAEKTKRVSIGHNLELFRKNTILALYDHLGSRSWVIAPNKPSYIISYMCTIQSESLYVILMELFRKTRFLAFV